MEMAPVTDEEWDRLERFSTVLDRHGIPFGRDF